MHEVYIWYCLCQISFSKFHENATLRRKVLRKMLLWLVSNPLMARGLLIMVLKLLMASFWIWLSLVFNYIFESSIIHIIYDYVGAGR